MQNAFDIVVFGASGFTGRLAAKLLSDSTSLKIAIAGRSQAKLEKIAASCQRRPEIIIADSSDPASIHKMVESSKVIANFAGPFALHGEPVMKACAELGKAYCDITGETPFVREMIDKYEATANKNGATIIPMSGFDSVPAELLTHIALKESEKKNWHPDEMTHYYQLQGGFNGGTLASALNMAETQQTEKLNDRNILIPDPRWERGPRISYSPEYEPLLKRWSAPFFMHPVNSAVVRRSLYLSDPGKPEKGRISYRERMLLGDGIAGRAQAYAVTGTLAAVGAMTENSIGRSVLRKLGPNPGEGPSDKSRSKSFYRGRLVVKEKNQPRLLVKMDGKGDPGNELTVLFATETAKLLLEGREKTKGFTTVSQAFGEELIQRLKNKGVEFSSETL